MLKNLFVFYIGGMIGNLPWTVLAYDSANCANYVHMVLDILAWPYLYYSVFF